VIDLVYGIDNSALKLTEGEENDWHSLQPLGVQTEGFFFYVVYCLLHYFITIVILQAFYLFTIVVTNNITVSFTQRLAPQVILN